MESIPFTPEERRLSELWEEHMRLEFQARDAVATVATMADENYVNHVPVLIGGRGRDELIFRFTHDIEMDWMLPGVAPTGRLVEVPLVVVVQLDAGEIVCERIYWDQASVLVQIGLLDAAKLPVAGAESARKVLDPSLPSNQLLRRHA